MDQDKLTRVRIQGMRTLADVELDLTRGLTVLIGDNGSGKSTIVEAFELLRQVPRPGQYVTDVIENLHGGLPALLRQGATELRLSARIEPPSPALQYGFAVGPVQGNATVRSEWVDGRLQPREADEHGPTLGDLRTKGDGAPGAPLMASGSAPHPLALVVSQQGRDDPLQLRIANALSRVEVHPAFDTRPSWLLAAQQQQFANARAPQAIERVDYLAATGTNLASCLQELRNDSSCWGRVMAHARLGLGTDLREVGVGAAQQRGTVAVEVWFGNLPKPLPLSALSEGQIAYLMFVALAEIGRSRSAIVVDEPELHLHPALVPRVAWMLEELAETTPVVVATHSDRFLDALANPADCVVLCELDREGATQIRRPDPVALADWMTDYRGLGQLRSEGHEQLVFGDSAVGADTA